MSYGRMRDKEDQLAAEVDQLAKAYQADRQSWQRCSRRLGGDHRYTRICT